MISAIRLACLLPPFGLRLLDNSQSEAPISSDSLPSAKIVIRFSRVIFPTNSESCIDLTAFFCASMELRTPAIGRSMPSSIALTESCTLKPASINPCKVLSVCFLIMILRARLAFSFLILASTFAMRSLIMASTASSYSMPSAYALRCASVSTSRTICLASSSLIFDWSTRRFTQSLIIPS